MDNPTNNFQLSRLPKNTFEITVEIAWDEIQKAKTKTLEEEGEKLEIKGFRKGKAPLNLVEESLGSKKALELALGRIIPDYYQKAVSELQVKPIVAPKVELISAKENQSWQIKFTACEMPEVKLGNYKDELKKISAGGKIWTPEKGSPQEKPEDSKKERDEKLQKIFDWFSKNIKVEIGDLLVEEEVSHKLSSLLEQTQKLGLTIDQYLASINKTVDSIREEYRKSVEQNLAIEFVLQEIAESEKIEVKPEDIEKILATAKDENEKKAMEAQKYLLASILRQQKTLDFLTSL